MPDNETKDPGEGFTFVDKRRAAETVEEESAVVTPSEDLLTDAPFDELQEDDGDSAASHSIYEVVAYCTGMLINEGFTRLGLIADPQTGKAVMDLPSARVAIDSVAALTQILDEPSSTLPEPVRREVKRTLNDLRLNYIERKAGS